MDAVAASTNAIATSSSRENEFGGVSTVVSDPMKDIAITSLQRLQKGISESSSNRPEQGPSLTHLSRPFNQNHQHSRQLGQGSRSRGRINGDSLRNQNYSNRRHQPRSFNVGNSNREHGNARAVNFHNQPHGFVKGASNYFEPPQPALPPYTPPNFSSVENHLPYFNLPHQPIPRLPQFPGYVLPVMYNGNPFFPESPALYGAPQVMAPLPYMEVMRGVVAPLRPQPPPVHSLPHPKAGLCNAILKQIEYYFSDANLDKDQYLRSQMNEQGWVSVYLIAGFQRIKNMTNDIDLILKALRPSRIVEIQGNKIRRRGDWMNYVIPSSSIEQTSSDDMLTAGIKNIQLDLRSESEVAKVECEG